nr:ATP-binding protein [Sphingomonas quercus]
MLVEEIGHRVINEFAEAISTLSLAARTAPSSAERASIERAALGLSGHAELHRALLPPTSAHPVSLPGYLARICQSFSATVLARRGVRLLLRSDEVQLASGEAWRVALIVMELVRNAARHAQLKPGGLITVDLTLADGGLTCSVCDSGQASPAARPGRGRHLVQSLAAELGGHATWRLGPAGSQARVDLPLATPICGQLSSGPSE